MTPNGDLLCDGGTFNNFGTITKSSAGDTTFAYPTVFNNSGDVQVQSGRLIVGPGSSTGSSASGTGWAPHRSQWTMGMGGPQYRCREISQSRRR